MPTPGLEYLAALLGGVAIQQHYSGRRATEQYSILKMKLHEYVAEISDKDAKLKSCLHELEQKEVTIAKLQTEANRHKKDYDHLKLLATSAEQERVRDVHVAQQLLQEERAKLSTLQQTEQKLQQLQAEKQTLGQTLANLLQQNDTLEVTLSQEAIDASTLAQQLLHHQAQNRTLTQQLSQHQTHQQLLIAEIQALQQQQQTQAAASFQQQQHNALLRQKFTSMQKRFKVPMIAIGSILSLYWYTQQHQDQQQQQVGQRDATTTAQLAGHPGLGLGPSSHPGLGFRAQDDLQLLQDLEGAVASVAADGTRLLSSWEEEDRKLATSAAWWSR
jgi:DNA repair exonuclease SbcCD ATPase subunit